VSKPSPGDVVAATTDVVATTTAVVRMINERAVYERIRSLRQASASQLVAATGLSKATIGLALANLERMGLIRNVGHRIGQVGRAPRLYEIRPDAGWAMAVDVGGSWIRLAVADLSGEIAARKDERVRARDAAALVRQVGDLARECAAQGGVSLSDITHTVVGFPGIHDAESDLIMAAPNLPGWDRPGSVATLRDVLGGQFSIDNDVNLAALAEQAYGVGAMASNFVFVSVGTGVGMGIVIGGNLYRGSSGRAGEISFLPVADGSERLATPAADVRRHGILETVASADGIMVAARRYGLTAVTAEEVFQTARSGDRAALQVVLAEAGHIARALAAVIAVLDPGLIVLGGGVGGNADLLLEPIRQRLGELLALSPPSIEVSKLGRDSVVLGGLAAGLERARDSVLAYIQA
jgi:predicted NBD/HSP70 family sugar kinase